MNTNKKDIQVSSAKSEYSPPTFIDLAPQFDNIFDNFADRFFGNRFLSSLDWPESPKNSMAHVRETENNYILTADIPGIPKEEIKINVHGNILTIRAEHKQESGSKLSDVGYRRQHRSFMQSFSLPSTVDTEKIEATSEHGVLEVLLPKTEKALPKNIEVKSGKRLPEEPPKH